MYENMIWTKGKVKSVILTMQQIIDSENKEYGSKFEVADREQMTRKRGEVAQKTRTFNKKYEETGNDEIIDTNEVKSLLNDYEELLALWDEKVARFKIVESHESDTVVDQAVDLSALLLRMKDLNDN
jgi:hypothetical protein